MSIKSQKQSLMCHLYSMVATFDPSRERIEIVKPTSAYLYDVNRFCRYLDGSAEDLAACFAALTERLASEGWENVPAPWSSSKDKKYWMKAIGASDYYIEVWREDGLSRRGRISLNIMNLG